MRKVIKLGKEAQESLKMGVEFANACVCTTLGPKGRNGMLGHEYQDPESTNDGVSILSEIFVEDEIEQMAIDKLKAIARETDKEAGDGTTTATVLANAIAQTGFARILPKEGFVQKKIDSLAIFNEIQDAGELVIQELDKMAVQITLKEDIEKVAFVSVENKKIAGMIAEMYYTIGKDGSITVEDGYDELESEIVEGLEIEAGFPFDNFANNDNKTFTHDKPVFLVTNQKIERREQIIPITTLLDEQGIKTLILIADDFGKEILEDFLSAKLNNSNTIIPIKTPYFGKKEKMEDIAIALGAYLFDKEGIRGVRTATVEDLGNAKKVLINKDKTVIFKPSGETKYRLDNLKSELKKTKDRFDLEQLKKRIAKLSGGVGVIKVGGTNRDYWKKKIEDANNATKNALQEGVVPGGGLALKIISETLPQNILTEALLSPYNQIQDNAGGNLVIGEDILDPVKTTKTALRNAFSVVGMILTTETAIADKYEKPTDYKLEE